MTDISKYLMAISGGNFSGRSEYLAKLVPENQDSRIHPKISVGELPNNYISGIAPNVEQELMLHSAFSSQEIKLKVYSLLYRFGYEKNYKKNPFNLSGGEQAILVLMNSLLLEPEILTIDTTLEQLHEEWRIPLLDALYDGFFPKTKCYISDNRIWEYRRAELISITSKNTETAYNYIFGSLKTDLAAENTQKPVSIQLNNLSFSYGEYNVFKNLSVRLVPGKIYRLSGRNGAGKSTLSKILAGILKVDKDMLMADNKPINAYRNPGQLAGYSQQNPDEQISYNTVEREILPFIKNESASYGQRRELFLSMFGLQQIRKCHPAELPFTMRKRIALASTLATERPWYILDEPTLGQDDDFIEAFSVILKKMAWSGKGIIFISHANKFSRFNSEEIISLP